MINLLSIRCSLGFAPDLKTSLMTYARTGAVAGRVVRQGGNGLLIRAAEAMVLRHHGREIELCASEVEHYLATLDYRIRHFDIRQPADEVVFASVADELYLSHPQSELWLPFANLAALLDAGKGEAMIADGGALPEWLTCSSGGGRLLLSDQRNGRWVLLAKEHLEDLARRLDGLRVVNSPQRIERPPVISVKGVIVHLQSAARLAEALESFVTTGAAMGYEDLAPDFSLRVAPASEGIEIKDFENRVGLNAREARKWAEIIRHELERLNLVQFKRGRISTVIADTEAGRWILQWGDEVLLTPEATTQFAAGKDGTILNCQLANGFVLLMNSRNGNCVALNEAEALRIFDGTLPVKK